jgi:hypothetical protein
MQLSDLHGLYEPSGLSWHMLQRVDLYAGCFVCYPGQFLNQRNELRMYLLMALIIKAATSARNLSFLRPSLAFAFRGAPSEALAGFHRESSSTPSSSRRCFRSSGWLPPRVIVHTKLIEEVLQKLWLASTDESFVIDKGTDHANIRFRYRERVRTRFLGDR